MQLENIVPHSEGDYERRVFVDAADANTWMNNCGFFIESSEFINSLPS